MVAFQDRLPLGWKSEEAVITGKCPSSDHLAQLAV